MADSKGYDEMVRRAITEPNFRKQLLRSPKEVIAKEGYDVGKDVVALIEGLDVEAAEAALANVDQLVGDRKAAW